MVNRSIILISFCIFFVVNLQASSPFQPSFPEPVTESWRWTTFTELEGFGTRTMEVASNDNIWFGGVEGLISYDGVTFKKRNDECSVLNTIVYCIYEDTNKRLFVVTKQGIALLENQKWKVLVQFPPETLVSWLTWLYSNVLETTQGEIYITTPFGAYYFSETQNKIIAPQIVFDNYDRIPKGFELEVISLQTDLDAKGIIFDLKIDHEGRFWFSLNNGLFGRFLNEPGWDASTPVKYYDIGQKNNPQGAVCFDQMKNGEFEVRTPKDTKWIYKYQKETDSFEPNKASTKQIFRSHLEMDDETNWYGGFGVLYKNDQGKWLSYKQPEYNVLQSKLNLKTDGMGNIWLIGEEDQVVRFQYLNEKYKSYKDLNFQCEDERGDRWFLHASSKVVVSSERSGQWILFNESDSIIEFPVSIHMDSKKNIWVIGSNQGEAAVSIKRHGVFFTKEFPGMCWGFDVRAYLEASDGKIYLGSGANCDPKTHGTVVYDPAKGDVLEDRAWKVYPGKEISEIIYGIEEMASGEILTGYYMGLSTWDGEKSVPVNEYLDKGVIISECMTKGISDEGEIWIGTRKKGVIKLVDWENWTRYTVEDGLAGNLITGLLAAKNGIVYAGTNQGISCFDGSHWKTHALPEDIKLLREAGSLMQSNDGAIWVNQNSRKWNRRQMHYLAGDSIKEGFELTTYSFKPDNNPPITQISNYEKKISSQGNTVIIWDAIDPWNYTDKQDIEFSYKLDDQEWSPYTTEKTHIFWGLGIGSHTFSVRARDKSLLVDNTPAKVKFRVMRPLWRNPVFITVILLILALLASMTYRIILRNNEIQKQNQAMDQRNKELRKQQDELKENSERILKLMDIEKKNAWFNEGVIKIDNILRSGTKDLNELSRKLIFEMVEYLNLSLIMIYLHVNDEDDFLSLVASYAKSSDDKEKVLIGEGLVGTTYVENETLRVENIPDDYVVSSGLGEKKVNELILFPLSIDTECIGILEMGAYAEISEDAIKLLEKITANIAVTFNNLLAKKKVDEMLNNSKKATVKLQEQEEELRQNLEELSSTQEEMHRKETMLLKQIEELKGSIPG